MGNSEHISLLKRGVKILNQWRQERPEAELDMSGGHFIGMDLRRANLNNSNLMGADFTGSKDLKSTLNPILKLSIGIEAEISWCHAFTSQVFIVS